MGLMSGKKGIILGVANGDSLAWSIAQRLHAEGATMAFSHLPGEKMERRVRSVTDLIGAEIVIPCDVTQDADIERFVGKVGQAYGSIDFIVHAVAFAPRECLANRFWQTRRADFELAMNISAYSLIAICQKAFHILREGGSVLTLSYLGAQKVVPGYNVMGVCKAALESSVRYLAADLGDLRRVRVNGISAGPCRTLSSAGISGFDKVLDHYPAKSPLKRNISPDEVAKAGLYLLSELSSGITGEIHYVDAGYSIIGW
ncbi:MAG: enoyl-ACP reductase [Planctomycetota bacterium]